MAARYAIYDAPPPGSALEEFGRTWIGRDAVTDTALAQPRVAGLAADRLAQLTADPRKYGFHGTLKPPFALADSVNADELRTALHAYARRRRAVLVGRLRLAEIGRFLALIPENPCPPLHDLAADIVEAFDRFRRPPDPVELGRRRSAGLNEAEEANLVRWGYPYVMTEFRFHLTLTGPLTDDSERVTLKQDLAEQTQSATEAPLVVSDLALFVQTASDQPFRIVDRARLTGGAETR
jgi:putative phosphonate metabolism protein